MKQKLDIKKIGSTWHFVKMYKGVRYSKSLKTGDKSKALVEMHKLNARLIQYGSLELKSSSEIKTMEELVDEFWANIDAHWENPLTDLTKAGYKTYVNKIKAAPFSKSKLDTIALPVIKSWKQSMTMFKHDSRYTWFLSRVFDYAVEMGYLDESPMKNYRNRVARKVDDSDDMCWDFPETAELLIKAKQYKPITKSSSKRYKTIKQWVDDWYDFTLIALETGIRINEQFGLYISDIDLNNDQFNISRTYHYKHGIGATKNPQSERTIEIRTQALKDAFIRQIARSRAKGNGNDGFLFTSEDNEPLHNGRTGEHWKRFCEHMGVRYLPFQNTRHTFATLRLAAGENVYWVAETMGHKGISTLLTKYKKYIKMDNYGLVSDEITEKLQKIVADAEAGESNVLEFG